MAGNDSYTKLLLHMDGTNGSVFFPDVAGAGHTLTPHGDAHIDTAQSKFGGSSGLFDGTGDYIDSADSDDWAFGSGDITIDFWLKRNTTGTLQRIFGTANSGGHGYTRSADASFNANDTFQWLVYHSGNTCVYFNSAVTITDSNWHHIACVRSGTNLWVFIDGTKDVNSANIGTNTLNDSTSSYAIGRMGEYNTDYFNGWLEEFRISKGIARWTSNFTPPTAPYSLEGSIIDAGPGSYTLTGSDLTPLAARMIGTGIQSYALSGADLTCLRTLLLNAGAGAHIITGVDAVISSGRMINAGSGSHVITGSDASTIANRILSASAGSLSITGIDSALLRTLLFNAASGAYTLTGFDAVLTKIIEFLLNAEPGSYAVTGIDANLLTSRMISSAGGIYAITSPDAALIAARIFALDSGAYEISAKDATFLLTAAIKHPKIILKIDDNIMLLLDS